ncbi:MAG: SHOCT domain-containing protein [Deltaproteobacteria bacterium]|nr:SHOCT domain-containing protein [Deltaproteobacteria bacterium]
MRENATNRLWVAIRVWAPAVLFVLLLASVNATAAQRSQTVENIPPRLHFAPVGTSPDQLVAAITNAAEDQGWRIIEADPGELTAILVRRTHEAVVTIGYDDLNFWIDYKDSKNLNYDAKERKRRTKGQPRGEIKAPRIHPNYNIWVAELADLIVLRTQNIPKSSDVLSPELIADELEKLDKLRQRGVLTQGEFDQRKEKLLAR